MLENFFTSSRTSRRVARTILVSVLLFAGAGALSSSPAHAQAIPTNASIEQTILSTKQVPADEVARIIGSPTYCDASETGGSCEKTYPKGTRVNFSYDSANRVQDLNIWGADGKLISERIDAGGASITKDAAGATIAEQPKVEGCSITGGMKGIGECIVQGIANGFALIAGALAYMMLIIASFMLWMVGGLFNWVVIKTVLQFGNYFGTSNGLLLAWSIMRDIGNIVLLFGFIFMGLATILNTHSMDEFSARKALPRLIIFAILLNFSLFASQLVIDVANSFATVFMTQAGTNCAGTAEVVGGSACANVGIAGSVLQLAGVAGIWDIVNIGRIGSFLVNAQQQAPVYLGLALFVTITAVVLLAGAIMLITRAVVLMFLMIMSPIGFAGMAIPPLQKLANEWWHKLISQAFFAPVFILLILISLKISEGLSGTVSGGSFTNGGRASLAAALIDGNVAGGLGPQVFVLFAVVIGFMIASLMVAKKLGAYGADFATQTAGRVVGGATLGSVGFIGRRTIGAGANTISNRIQKSSFAQTRPNLARLAQTPFKKTAEASFSVRGVATNAGKGAGLDFGKPNKAAAHGFHGVEEKLKKKREDFFKGVKPTKEQSGVADEVEKELDEVKAELESRRAGELAAVQEQRRKVERARLDNDEKLLKAERAELEKKITAYETKNSDDEGKELMKRRDKLDGRLKQWKKYADNAKLEGYVDGLHNSFSVLSIVPGSPEAHANHEAAISIRKSAGKSKLDKAINDLKEGIKDEEGGEAASPEPAPAATTAAPAGGGGAHAADSHTH